MQYARRFESSGISITCDVALRTTVRDARFIQCDVAGSTLRAAIVDDVLVDGLRTSGNLQTWGAVFNAEAEFQEADLRGVPGHLVRRDPATQVLVTREKAESLLWKDVDMSGTHWVTSLAFFVQHSVLPSIVLVAPKRSRDFNRLREGLERLRAAGIAEPD